MREGFIFYASWMDAIKNLPRDIQGDVLTAIIEYGLYGETTDNLKPITKAMLSMVKPQIDANNQRYENGKKGGRPKVEANQGETKQKPKNNQSETKQEPKEKEKEKDKDKYNTPCNPPAGDKEAYDEFERFRKAYPGNRRGLKIEFDNFKKKHSDYRTAVFLLYPALEKLNEWREQKRRLNQFVPEYANLSTWLNQRRWEMEFEKVEENETTETKRYDNGDFLR